MRDIQRPTYRDMVERFFVLPRPEIYFLGGTLEIWRPLPPLPPQHFQDLPFVKQERRMLAIRTGTPPRCLDYVEGTGGLVICREDARPPIMMEGRREEQTPIFGHLSARPKDDLTRIAIVFCPVVLFS